MSEKIEVKPLRLNGEEVPLGTKIQARFHRCLAGHTIPSLFGACQHNILRYFTVQLSYEKGRTAKEIRYFLPF